MGVALEAVARAIEMLREMVPPVPGGAWGKVGLAQFSAKSSSLRIASVSEIFGFWRFPQALPRPSCSFENNMFVLSVATRAYLGEAIEVK
jgi:hypothetical protein